MRSMKGKGTVGVNTGDVKTGFYNVSQQWDAKFEIFCIYKRFILVMGLAHK